jgi:hypothetical protein
MTAYPPPGAAEAQDPTRTQAQKASRKLTWFSTPIGVMVSEPELEAQVPEQFGISAA